MCLLTCIRSPLTPLLNTHKAVSNNSPILFHILNFTFSNSVSHLLFHTIYRKRSNPCHQSCGHGWCFGLRPMPFSSVQHARRPPRQSSVQTRARGGGPAAGTRQYSAGPVAVGLTRGWAGDAGFDVLAFLSLQIANKCNYPMPDMVNYISMFFFKKNDLVSV